MGAREDQRRRQRTADEARRSIGRELRQIREDTGLTQRRVAEAAGISPAHLCWIERGRSEANTAVLVAIADVLGADLAIRAYPTTGPRIRDRLQAVMDEALLVATHIHWRPFVEVPVTRPARGYIDVVLRDRSEPLYVATEVHSELRRVEQSLRWAQDKASSLPSAALWAEAPADARVDRLLVLRSTHATREVAARLPVVLGAAYPARMRDVVSALVDGGPWPGAGIVWMRVEGGRAELLDGPPRGVALGR